MLINEEVQVCGITGYKDNDFCLQLATYPQEFRRSTRNNYPGEGHPAGGGGAGQDDPASDHWCGPWLGETPIAEKAVKMARRLTALAALQRSGE